MKAVKSSNEETSTTTPEVLYIEQEFKDKVIRNVDTRVLVDARGKILLLYAFPDQKTLIITTNENTLTEIISRINTARVF